MTHETNADRVEQLTSKYVDITVRFFPPEDAAEVHTKVLEGLQAMADKMIEVYRLIPVPLSACAVFKPMIHDDPSLCFDCGLTRDAHTATWPQS
ncbi:hypothetical protein [Rhodococcoides fascians]|uniref:hypothetical protein n=1 Tax=Rhodococcoides fascians TaxID=1828 RepID=UPI00050C46E3|nr:hypothetical protein [Rhodococcus fascians]